MAVATFTTWTNFPPIDHFSTEDWSRGPGPIFLVTVLWYFYTLLAIISFGWNCTWYLDEDSTEHWCCGILLCTIVIMGMWFFVDILQLRQVLAFTCQWESAAMDRTGERCSSSCYSSSCECLVGPLGEDWGKANLETIGGYESTRDYFIGWFHPPLWFANACWGTRNSPSV